MVARRQRIKTQPVSVMYKDKQILAVVLARGGSKGIKDKNVKDLAGKPLLAWTIEEARKSKYIDRLILSSDSQKIIDVAQNFGCETPFVRPKELAEDEVPSIDPFIHAIASLQEKYDYALLLQCTSPLRTVEDIDGAICFCIDKGANSCIGTCEAKKSPYKMQLIDHCGRLRPLFDAQKVFAPRQQLPKIYVINGAIYMIRIDVLFKTRRLLNNDETLAYLMNDENSLDIDDLMDCKIAEMILKDEGRKGEKNLR